MDFAKLATIQLIKGAGGGDPRDGLCIMEMVSYFSGAVVEALRHYWSRETATGFEHTTRLVFARGKALREAADAITTLVRKLAEMDSVRAENETAMRAGDWVYQQQRNAEWAAVGDHSPEQDVASTALYRGNSVGWIYSKAENYKKALGRVWDALREHGIYPDGKTHCADAVAKALRERPTHWLPLPAPPEVPGKE